MTVTSNKQEGPARNEKGQLQKGHTANPNGRPKKGYSITETFREMFQADPTKKQELMMAIFKKAMQGDASAMKLVWSYMDGSPLQGIELSGPEGGPVETSLNVTFESSSKED